MKYVVYTNEQIAKIWQSVSYNDSRLWAFYSDRNKQWYHPKNCFTQDKLRDFVHKHRITDIHVKACTNNLGREWIVDLDFHDTDPEVLHLKMRIANKAFEKFFYTSIQRTLWTGNRGLHIWLNPTRFPMTTPADVRKRYYKAFVVPSFKSSGEEQIRIAPEGSFISCVQHAIEQFKEDISIKLPQFKDEKELLAEIWPPVDELVFSNLNQIRAPYSFNSKGKNFSVDFEQYVKEFNR